MRRVRNSERTACRMRCMRSTASSPSYTETTKAKSLLFSARIVAFSKWDFMDNPTRVCNLCVRRSLG